MIGFVLLLFIGCSDKEVLNCKCEYISYEREAIDSEWIEIEKITRITNCNDPSFFVISNKLLTKELINCN